MPYDDTEDDSVDDFTPQGYGSSTGTAVAPPAPPFSYASDVAPYASKFFSKVGANSNLSMQQKQQIQGTLLNGMSDIQSQRDKMQARQLEVQSRSLAYSSQAFALEDARAKRARLQQQQAQLGEVQSMASNVLGQPPDVARKALAAAELKYADNPLAQNAIRNAGRFIPSHDQDYTPYQMAEIFSKLGNKYSPEDLHALSQNPMAAGQAMALEARDAEERKSDLRLATSAKEQDMKMKNHFATLPLKFNKPQEYPTGEENDFYEKNGAAKRMTDESRAAAKKIIRVLGGTPEEIAHADSLDKAPTDRELFLMAQNMQLRHLQGGVPAAAVPAAPKVTGKSIIDR